MYSNFFCVPRFSSSSFRHSPRESSRVMTVASMIGSSICLISAGFGNLLGLSTISSEPFNRVILTHARRRGDQVDVELALQPLLHDLQMQQSQESAAEPEAQRHRVLGLEVERAVIQAGLFQSVTQQTVLVRFDGIQASEHHRL